MKPARCQASVTKPGAWRSHQCRNRANGRADMVVTGHVLVSYPACGTHRRADLPTPFHYNPNSTYQQPLKVTLSGEDKFPIAYDASYDLGPNEEAEIKRKIENSKATITEIVLYNEVLRLREAIWGYSQRLAVAWPEQQHDLTTEAEHLCVPGTR